jgi:hypothetical protein
MLYGIFAVFMILLSMMGIVHMIVFESYTYIIFPISTLVWGFYKFFKENDEEFCRRNNIEPCIDIGWLLGFGDDDAYYTQYDSYNNRGYTRYQPTTHTSRYQYSDPEYKKILPRCRRNSMVKTNKVKTKEETTI